MPGPLYAALPAMLRDMANACGISVTMRFIEWRGNTRLFVPKKPVPDHHELVLQLGRLAADWLVYNYAGKTIIVPRATALLREARDEEIRNWRGKVSGGEAALRVGLTERQIWRIWSDVPDEPEEQPQTSLL